jgi:hypothetical protein|tara:strand:+ start:794 stop:1312 length:519 start_codon:yes stop_codon:yes gene_type:complete
MYDNYNPQTYEINGDNIMYNDDIDPEYPLNNPIPNHPQHFPNDPSNYNLYNNTDTETPLLYSLNIFFTLAIFTFTSIQLARCYYKLENYIRNQRNQNNVRSPLNRNVNINSINTLVVCDDLPDNICSVCLEDFKDDDILKKLNCTHVFHKECLEPWLNNNNRNCPLCRTDII